MTITSRLRRTTGPIDETMSGAASGADPDGPRSTGRQNRSSGWMLEAGWLALAIVPLASAVSAASAGLTPVGDGGVITALSIDSLSTDLPLVGMPTSLSSGGALVHHPGPIGFWLLAGPTKLLGAPGYGVRYGAALIAAASIACLGGLARRWRAPLLEATVLLLVGALVATVGGTNLSDPFNPMLGILPFLVFLVAAWGVLVGHHRQLWIAVLAGSVAAEVHLGFVPLVVAVLAVMAASLAVDARRGSSRVRRRLGRRIVPVAVLLGLIAWVGPIVDQIAGGHNLTGLLAARRQQHGSLGIRYGFNLLVEMTSVPPRWLLGRAQGDQLLQPGGLRIGLSILTLSLAALLVVAAFRRRDRASASIGLLGLVLVTVATVSSANVVDAPFLHEESLFIYRVFWWPVGVVFLLSLIWGLAQFSSRGRVALGPRPGRPAPWVVAGVVAFTAVLASWGHQRPNAAAVALFRQDLPHAEAISNLPGRPRTVQLVIGGNGSSPGAPRDTAFVYAPGLIAQLRLRGIAVRFPPDVAASADVSAAYRHDHPSRGDEDLVVLFRAGPPALEEVAGYRRISRAGPKTASQFGLFGQPTAVFVPEE